MDTDVYLYVKVTVKVKVKVKVKIKVKVKVKVKVLQYISVIQQATQYLMINFIHNNRTYRDVPNWNIQRKNAPEDGLLKSETC